MDGSGAHVIFHTLVDGRRWRVARLIA